MKLFAIVTTMFLAMSGLAAAQPYETPEALLEAFYAPYFADEFPEDDASFRSQALQALYDADAEATPEGEMRALGFDPYIDGQDWELTDFEIGAAGIAGDYASADVSFKNFGEEKTLSYELVREDGGWKIDDVVSTAPENPYRLSEIFASARAE